MEIAELLARECIRDTIANYNHAGDGGRYDAMVECFTPDGELRIVGGAVHRGHDELRSFFSNVNGISDRLAQLTVLRHCVTNILINVTSPTTATSRAYFQVLTNVGLDHWGSYHDEFEAVDNRWLIATRSVRTDAYTPNSFFE